MSSKKFHKNKNYFRLFQKRMLTNKRCEGKLWKQISFILKKMNLKAELRKRNIPFREFREAIGYTQQGVDKAVGTDTKPKPISKIMRLAFLAFLVERTGIKLEKLI